MRRNNVRISKTVTIVVGFSLVSLEHHAPIRSKKKKIGECLVIPETEPANCEGNDEDVCTTDDECPGIQKCCSNGCYKGCMYAEITTGNLCREFF